jgi:hypothetical protein
MIGSQCVAATMIDTDGKGIKTPTLEWVKLFTIGFGLEIFSVKEGVR